MSSVFQDRTYIPDDNFEQAIIDLGFDDVLDDYISFNKESCTIFVDSSSFTFLKGSLIDYVDDGLNKGIKFINPNAKAVCGCGESFTL